MFPRLLSSSLVIGLLAFTGFSVTAAPPVPVIRHWHLLGSIGDYPVQMDLRLGMGSIGGHYSYERQGGDLWLVGELGEGGQILLSEYADIGDDKATGVFTLSQTKNGAQAEFTGTWSKPGSAWKLPVLLRSSMAFENLYQSPKIPQLLAERPLFMDGFRPLAAGSVLDADGQPWEAPDWDGGHGEEFWVRWHRPDVALSLTQITSENVGGAAVGEGKADYEYSHYHFRIAKNQVVPLRLEDFFEKDSGWQDLMPEEASSSEGFYQFTYDARGITFHSYEDHNQDLAHITWQELSEVLRPGWPQALGIVPTVSYTEPEPGSAERATLLTAAAEPLRKRRAGDEYQPEEIEVRWEEPELFVKGEWAVLHAVPRFSIRGSGELEPLAEEDASEADREDPTQSLVLHRDKTGWKVMHIIVPEVEEPEGAREKLKELLPPALYRILLPRGF